MMKLSYIPPLIALIATSGAIASPTDYVEVGYNTLKIDGMSVIKPSGYGVAINKNFDSFYITAGYHTSDDSFENSNLYEDAYYKQTENEKYTLSFSQTEIGIGKIFNISETSTIDIVGSYTNFKVKNKVAVRYKYESVYGDVDDFSKVYNENSTSDLFTIEAVHNKTFGNVTTRLGLGFERIQDQESENNLVYLAELSYAFTDNLSTNVKYRNADEYYTLGAYIQYTF
jgi:hypothetical protein